MRRVLLALLLLLVAAIALPPLYFAVFPAEVFELPPPGRRIPVGDGVAVNAVERGAGPPVVLVHGLPGTAYDWAPLTEALAARGLFALAYGRVGFGRSDPRPDDDFTVEANARELVALLEAEDLRDATVVGWSYGGPVAIRAAGFAPDRIARLVLVGSGGPAEVMLEPPAGAAVLFSRPVLAWMAAVPPVARGLRSVFSVQAFSEGPQPDWWMTHVHANLDNPTALRAWREEGARFGSEELYLEAAPQPILLIHGDDDRSAPLAISEWFHRNAADSELVVIDGGSHMLPITHADLLADRIAAFVGVGS